ncbi:MAG: trypsin-like serine peptidase [Planctomycetales bacterium]
MRNQTLTFGLHSATGVAAAPTAQNGGVWGNDTRTQIEYTTRAPWRSICSLQMRFPNFSRVKWGAGAIVGRRVIMTAGHCVFDPQLGWAQSVVVTPGQNRASGGPYGSYTTNLIRSVDPWVNGDAKGTLTQQLSSPYDYGAVIVETPIGDQTGLMSFGAVPDPALAGLIVYTAGYPVDEPLGTMWATAGQIQTVSPTRLDYLLDVAEGNSGGPVFDFDPTTNGRTIVAIHTAWTPQADSGVRITPAVAAKYRAWIQEFS